MFLKSINPPTIDQYPYSFENLKQDNPNTLFPHDYLSQSHTNLIFYGVYAVVDNPPQLTETRVIESKIPVYNSELNQFEFNYTLRDKTEDELRQEKYNPVQFKKELNTNTKWAEWTDTIIATNPKALIFLLEAFNNYISTGDNQTVQLMYDNLKTSISLPVDADIEWQTLADNYGIGLSF